MKPTGSVFLFLLLPIIFHQVSGFNTSIDTVVVDNDALLVQCTYELVKKYFYSGESLSGSVLAVSLASGSQYLQNRILQTFHMDANNSWSIMVRFPRSHKSKSGILHEKPQTYIVLLENLDDDDMEDVFNDWKSMPNWNPLAQFVVFFAAVVESEEEMTDIMIEILLMFLTRKIFNINVVAQTEEDGRIYSKSAFPYEPANHCGSRVIVYKTLDTCEFGDEGSGSVNLEEHTRGLFLDKIPKDLSGCPLVVYSRSWEPYMFMEDGQIKGIEWMLVNTIADILHVGFEIKIENKTLFHLFQSLIDGKVDIVIGGIDEDPNLSNLVSATVPYLEDDLTWCVTKAKRTLHWLNFLHVFPKEAYLTYTVFVLTNTCVIYVIQKCPCVTSRLRYNFSSILFVLTGFVFNQSIRAVIFNTSLRICLLMTFSATLILGSMYNSFLVSSLTSPSTLPQIKKTTQLLDHKMSITGSVDIIRHLDKEGDVFMYIRREFMMCYNMEECLQSAAYNDRLAVAISRQYSLHNSRIPRDNLYCFDHNENIYTYRVTMLMPKKFHLFHQINPIIQYIIESGHLLKWTRDLELDRVLKAKGSEEANKAASLELNQIIGVLALGFIFFLMAAIVLGVEILIFKMQLRGSRVKIVRILHSHFLSRK